MSPPEGRKEGRRKVFQNEKNRWEEEEGKRRTSSEEKGEETFLTSLEGERGIKGGGEAWAELIGLEERGGGEESETEKGLTLAPSFRRRRADPPTDRATELQTVITED